jgi:hypothetical protein
MPRHIPKFIGFSHAKEIKTYNKDRELSGHKIRLVIGETCVVMNTC